MNKGITFDEIIMQKIGMDNYFEYIENLNITNIELCLHEQIISEIDQASISAFCRNKNILNSFHIPHHINEYAYDSSNFRNESNLIKDNYNLFLNDLENHLLVNPQTTSTVVIHGGSFDSPDKKSHAIESFKSLIDFFLNKSISRGININLLMETLEYNENRIGTSYIDLLNISNFFSTEYLSICCDIGHIMRYPEFNFLERLKEINHFHLHGYNKKSRKNHLPISKSDFYPEEILQSIEMDSTLIHEVLYFCSNYNYLDDLKTSIELIE